MQYVQKKQDAINIPTLVYDIIVNPQLKMADLNKPSGYPLALFKNSYYLKDYICKQCECVAREAHIITCCGEILCKSCVDGFSGWGNGPCPSCRDNDFVTVKHVGYHTKILALEVSCLNKNNKCPWTGQLQHLDAHLDVTTGDCQYVDVECPNKCVQKVQKRNVDTHLANECQNRDYRCPHCKLSIKFCVFVAHYKVCPSSPIPCPNNCEFKCEGKSLEGHLQVCTVEGFCGFTKFGCMDKFLKKDENDHMDQNTQKHLALVAAATQRIRQDYQEKLQLRDSRIKALQEEIRQKRLLLQKQYQDLLPAINRIHSHKAVPPYDLALSGYSLKKAQPEIAFPSMYTHIGGYKFSVGFFLNGAGSSRGSHLSARMRVHKSPYEHVLKYPVKLTITLQLLNQHRDQDHHTRYIQCVIKGKDWVGHIGADWTFIPHADLEWNRDKQTQYLKDDCLKFRITKIVVHKLDIVVW